MPGVALCDAPQRCTRRARAEVAGRSGDRAVPPAAYAIRYLAWSRRSAVAQMRHGRSLFVWDGIADALGDVARSRRSACSSCRVAWLAQLLVVRSIGNLTVPVALAAGAVRCLAEPLLAWATFSARPCSISTAHVTIAFVLPLVALPLRACFGTAWRRAVLVLLTLGARRRSGAQTSTTRPSWPGRGRTATGARCSQPRPWRARGRGSFCADPFRRTNPK